jgi:hypothetical protein
LLNRYGQVLAAVGSVLVAAATLAVAAGSADLLVAALARRQLSTEAAFERHQVLGEHT